MRAVVRRLQRLVFWLWFECVARHFPVIPTIVIVIVGFVMTDDAAIGLSDMPTDMVNIVAHAACFLSSIGMTLTSVMPRSSRRLSFSSLSSSLTTYSMATGLNTWKMPALGSGNAS